MARTFDGTTANYLSASDTSLTNEPMSFGCQFLTNSIAVNQALVASGNNGASGMFVLRFDGATANDPVLAQKQNDAGTVAAASLNTTVATGTWHGAGATFGSDTARDAYWSSTTGTNTTSITDPTSDFLSVGVLRRNAISIPTNGNIAEVGVWTATLTQFEHESLQHGCSPMLVRPTSLVRYYPLFGGYSVGGESDWMSGGVALTETGTVGNAAHPSQLAYPVP